MMPIAVIQVEPWMVRAFALASGDRNEPHFPGPGPKRFGQEGPITHGALTAELIRAAVVQRAWPGRPLIRISHEEQFRGPVPWDSVIIPSLEILEDTEVRVVVRLSATRGDQEIYRGTTIYSQRNLDVGLLLPPLSLYGLKKSQQELREDLGRRAEHVQPFPYRPAGISTETKYGFKITEEVVQGATALLGPDVPDLNEAVLCFFMSQVSALHIPGYILLGTSGEYTGCPLWIGDELVAKPTVTEVEPSRQGLKRLRASIEMLRVSPGGEQRPAGTLTVHKQALPVPGEAT